MRMNNLYSIHIEYVQYSVFTQLNFSARSCSLITWNWNGFNWIFTVLFTFTLCLTFEGTKYNDTKTGWVFTTLDQCHIWLQLKLFGILSFGISISSAHLFSGYFAHLSDFHVLPKISQSDWCLDFEWAISGILLHCSFGSLLRALSCCKGNLCLNLQYLAAWKMCLALSILPQHNAPWFTVRMVLSGWWAVLSFCLCAKTKNVIFTLKSNFSSRL